MDWADVKNRFRQFIDALIQERMIKEITGDITADLGDFCFLDHTRYDMPNNVTILGCSLFSHVPRERKEKFDMELDKLFKINDWSLTDHNDAHIADLGWLNEQVESISTVEPEKKIVIFTHHCPTVDERAIDPAHQESVIGGGFVTDLSKEGCFTNDKVALWAFGHSHYNCDFTVPKANGNEMRVYSNQRGYHYIPAKGNKFDPRRVIHV